MVSVRLLLTVIQTERGKGSKKAAKKAKRCKKGKKGPFCTFLHLFAFFAA
jgi:hypothetical protein